MSSLWFVVPAFGRFSLTKICLRQLRRTCDALTKCGVEATAVVIADDENLDMARELGFGTVERDNRFTSRKYNDGIQFACDPRFNQRPADYVVPCGSDDWVHPSLFTDLPPIDTMVGFQHMSFVRDDGLELTHRVIDNPGGCGIRIYSREIVAMLGYRPADEDRPRACDTSILVNLKHACRFKLEHRVIDPRLIVDWKSPDEQLNPYSMVAVRYRQSGTADPYETLADLYPADALEEMREHYGQLVLA